MPAQGTVLLRVEPLRIVFFNSLVLGGGVSLNLTTLDAIGFRSVRGYYFTATAAAAAGFPRMRQSPNNTNFDLVEVIPQDFSQANFTYTFDLPIIARFISLEWTSGAGGANPLRADVSLVP